MTRIAISMGIWAVGGALTILLFFVEFFLTILLFPFDRKRKIIHAQCFWWSDAVIAINPFWQINVTGLENIDRRQTYVMVANHQSLADIIILYKTRAQFKWVAKESLFNVPFVGWCLSLTKHIRLMRGELSSIKKVYREAAGWLRNGISVLFFPEGTRSETNEMNEFQNGAFKLAIKERRPILPILISGTRDAIPKGDWLFRAKVFCALKVLPAVDTSDYKPGDFGRLRDDVRARLTEAAR